MAITLVELRLSLLETNLAIQRGMERLRAISWLMEKVHVPIKSASDVVLARQIVRRGAQQAGLSLVDQTKIVTAASELARNTVIYGLGGEMTMEVYADGERRGVRLTFVDQGPGIADIDLALKDGWTSGDGLGLGLPGTRRLVKDFKIESRLGEGTRVSIAHWNR